VNGERLSTALSLALARHQTQEAYLLALWHTHQAILDSQEEGL